MTQNFFALCHAGGDIEIKRMRLTRSVRDDLTTMFSQQEVAFKDDVSEELEFAGDWKPDDHELMTIEDFPEKQALLDTATANGTSYDDLDLANFENEPVKAIFTTIVSGRRTKVLIQRFTARQMLARGYTLILDDNTFTKLTQPAFSLGRKLACIIEDDLLKFKDFAQVKSLFTLLHYYEEATDGQIDSFFNRTSPLQVRDIAGFKVDADQTTRKLIHAITKRGTLGNHTVAQIRQSAANMNLNLRLSGGKLILPDDRREMKKFLHLLDDSFYTAPLSREQYITNSKKRTS